MVVTRSTGLGNGNTLPEETKEPRKTMKKRKQGKGLVSKKEIPPKEEVFPEEQAREETPQALCLPWDKVILVLVIILGFLAFCYFFIFSFEKEDPRCLPVEQIGSEDDFN